MQLLQHINQSGKHFLKEVAALIQKNHSRKINHIDVNGVDAPYLYIMTYNDRHQVEIIVSIQIHNYEQARIAMSVNHNTNSWLVSTQQLEAEDLSKTIMAFCV